MVALTIDIRQGWYSLSLKYKNCFNVPFVIEKEKEQKNGLELKKERGRAKKMILPFILLIN